MQESGKVSIINIDLNIIFVTINFSTQYVKHLVGTRLIMLSASDSMLINRKANL